MLSATLLLAALAATAPDEVVVIPTPEVTEEEAPLTGEIVDEPSASEAEVIPQSETIDQSREHVRPQAVVADRAQKPQSVVITTVIRAAPIDSAPPVVAITSPTTNPITRVVGNALMISGTATDDVAIAAVKWQLTGTRTGSGNLPTTAGTWTHTFTSLVVGTYTFTVTATDTVGKPSAAVTRTITITRAGTPPPTTPPPDQGDDNSGDIKKDVKKCGIGGGIATFLLLFGSLAALVPKRRIE